MSDPFTRALSLALEQTSLPAARPTVSRPDELYSLYTSEGDHARRAESRFAWDMYCGDQLRYIPRLPGESAAEFLRRPHKQFLNVTRVIIDVLSQLYRRQVERNLDADATTAERIQRVWDRNPPDRLLLGLDRLARLQGVAAVRVSYERGEVRYWPWPAHRLVAIPDPDSPDAPICVIAFAAGDGSLAHVWSPERVSTVAGGRILDEQQHGLGRVPFAFVHDRLPVDGFWVEGRGRAVAYANAEFNAKLSELAHTVAMQGFGVMEIVNPDPSNEIAIGPGRAIAFNVSGNASIPPGMGGGVHVTGHLQVGPAIAAFGASQAIRLGEESDEGIAFGADATLYRQAEATLRTDGNLEIGGKLTVAGLIDPTGLQLEAQAANPGSGSTIWVDSGDGSLRLGSQTLLRDSQNLADVADPGVARGNLGLSIGSDVQAFDDDLDAIAALGGTGIAVRTAANTWAQRSIAASSELTVANGNGVSANPTISITANGISNAMLRDSAGLSVIGRSASSTGDPADIAAASDHQVLRRSGATIGFGQVNLAQSNAVTGALPIANGGTGATAARDALSNLGTLKSTVLQYTGSGSSGKQVTLTGVNRAHWLLVTRQDGTSSQPIECMAMGGTGSVRLHNVGNGGTNTTWFSLDAPSAGTAQVLTLNTSDGTVNASGVTYRVLVMGTST